MVKKTTVLLIILLIVLSGCKNIRENSLIPIKVAIFPTNSTVDSYLVIINKDGKVDAFCGVRKDFNIKTIKKDDYLNVLDKKNRNLTSEEIKTLKKLENEIASLKQFENQKPVDDSWEATILINNKIYNFILDENQEKSYGQLVKKIIEYSPLEIDTNGWGQNSQ